MKKFTNSKLFSSLIFILSIVVIAKVIWVILAMLFLPKSGQEHITTKKLEPLYYPIKLASKNPIKVAPQATIVKSTVKKIGNMQGYKLLALYNASDSLVVTVEKGKKTKVLSRDEDIDGFKLKSAGSNFAIFTKGEKEFKLMLKGSKSQPLTNSIKSALVSNTSIKKEPITKIRESDDGVGKIVSKGLLSSYTKDIDKVWKDIGIGDYKVNGELQGFKVNFIKKGSDFEELGLQKGDILTSVNGQELKSYDAAYNFYKEIESIENLTINIKRNNQEMELEYEIQ